MYRRHLRHQVMVALGLSAAAIAVWSGNATTEQLQDQGCVVITSRGTVLPDPVLGEDDGHIYCPTGQTTGEARIEEDDPLGRWDCETMGNKVCG